jgi:signal transduction histidine kinase
MKELHNLATDLRPVGLDRFGLYVMLGQIVTLFRNELKMQVDFKFNGPTDKRLPLAMETALYRIVQEAFTNIARHSHARNASLQFSLEDICVKLIIKDDGIGFDTSTLPGEGRLGLLGIQERVEMMGGTFVLESTPGKGTILLVEVPLDQKNLDR